MFTGTHPDGSCPQCVSSMLVCGMVGNPWRLLGREYTVAGSTKCNGVCFVYNFLCFFSSFFLFFTNLPPPPLLIPALFIPLPHFPGLPDSMRHICPHPCRRVNHLVGLSVLILLNALLNFINSPNSSPVGSEDCSCTTKGALFLPLSYRPFLMFWFDWQAFAIRSCIVFQGLVAALLAVSTALARLEAAATLIWYQKYVESFVLVVDACNSCLFRPALVSMLLARRPKQGPHCKPYRTRVPCRGPWMRLYPWRSLRVRQVGKLIPFLISPSFHFSFTIFFWFC